MNLKECQQLIEKHYVVIGLILTALLMLTYTLPLITATLPYQFNEKLTIYTDFERNCEILFGICISIGMFLIYYSRGYIRTNYIVSCAGLLIQLSIMFFGNWLCYHYIPQANFHHVLHKFFIVGFGLPIVLLTLLVVWHFYLKHKKVIKHD